MSDLNSVYNRIVWCDIPVADLDRAATFYRAVLGIKVERMEFDGQAFCILEHDQGNGGCLVADPARAGTTSGPLIYLNVDRRLREATANVEEQGGSVEEPPHPIGPHGFRAIVIDSEGNRVALHSTVDA